MSINKEEVKRVKVEFKAAWSIILDDILTESKFKDIRSSVDWMETVMEKNVPFGKQTRALLSILTYNRLNPVRSQEDDFLTYVGGWVIEIFQASALIADDVMDDSETRRGMSCWYKNSNVGMSAVNDAFLLENMAYYIMFKYFADKEYFLRLLQLTNDVNVKTILGESLDLKMTNEMPLYEKFNEQTYKALVKYKTSYYSFYGPVAAAMVRAGVKDPECYKAVEEITLKIGHMFQIQDDFLDCYGQPHITGKLGTDIKDGKLTWLIVKALQLASEPQKRKLQEYYGQPDSIDAERKVKEIYNVLGIEEVFYKYEDQLKREILTAIKALPSAIPQSPFMSVLNAIYRREK